MCIRDVYGTIILVSVGHLSRCTEMGMSAERGGVGQSEHIISG